MLAKDTEIKSCALKALQSGTKHHCGGCNLSRKTQNHRESLLNLVLGFFPSYNGACLKCNKFGRDLLEHILVLYIGTQWARLPKNTIRLLLLLCVAISWQPTVCKLWVFLQVPLYPLSTQNMWFFIVMIIIQPLFKDPSQSIRLSSSWWCPQKKRSRRDLWPLVSDQIYLTRPLHGLETTSGYRIVYCCGSRRFCFGPIYIGWSSKGNRCEGGLRFE